jgi:ketosteroid isomerase-like protein
MEESAEIVRRSFEAWNRNDWEALERFYDPAVTALPPAGWPETGLLEGWEAVRAQFARNKDSWEEEHVEIEEIDELRPDLLVARVRWKTRGKDSGLTFESPVHILFGLRAGRITRLEYYFDRGDAERRIAQLVG